MSLNDDPQAPSARTHPRTRNTYLTPLATANRLPERGTVLVCTRLPFPLKGRVSSMPRNRHLFHLQPIMDTALLVILILATAAQGSYAVLAYKTSPRWLIWLRYLFILLLVTGIVCVCLPLSAYPEDTGENTPGLIAKGLACGSIFFVKVRNAPLREC